MANWVPLWLHRLGSPPVFYRFAGAVRPWAFGLALLLGAVALYGGLVVAPADYQQGDAYRIIFIHVPSAWMSLFIYGAMAVAAFVGLVWRIKIAEVVAMMILGGVLAKLGWRKTMMIGVAGHALRFGIYAFFPQNQELIVAVQLDNIGRKLGIEVVHSTEEELNGPTISAV